MHINVFNVTVNLYSAPRGRIKLEFPYSHKVKEWLKSSFENYEWDNDKKSWYISGSLHNMGVIRKYLSPLILPETKELEYTLSYLNSKPTLTKYQQRMADWIVSKKRSYVAAIMGAGKTLAVFAACDHIKPKSIIWVAPNSALMALTAEISKWGFGCNITAIPYTKINPKSKADLIVFDESHYCKNIGSAQRAINAAELSQNNQDAYVVAMSGTPAPKSPVDWWGQVELLYPGYLDYSQRGLKDYLTLQEKSDDLMYSKVITWFDKEGKCLTCGNPEMDVLHEKNCSLYHKFENAGNRVSKLSKLLEPLVISIGDEALEGLPDYIEHKIKIKPTLEVMRMANEVAQLTQRAGQTLTKLRCLSDGFIYDKEKTSDKICEVCNGTGIYTIPTEHECFCCNGTGKEPVISRSSTAKTTAKDKALVDLLEMHGDRIIVSAAFQASIDRLKEVIVSAGWDYISLDGRGVSTSLTITPTRDACYDYFQNGGGKVCWLANAQSSSTGLTLTRSPSIIFYSCAFNADHHDQFKARIRRNGSTGTNIYYLLYLPSDYLVLENLTLKNDLQKISLSEIRKCF